jgi:hypothetical protein
MQGQEAGQTVLKRTKSYRSIIGRLINGVAAGRWLGAHLAASRTHFHSRVQNAGGPLNQLYHILGTHTRRLELPGCGRHEHTLRHAAPKLFLGKRAVVERTWEPVPVLDLMRGVSPAFVI